MTKDFLRDIDERIRHHQAELKRLRAAKVAYRKALEPDKGQSEAQVSGARRAAPTIKSQVLKILDGQLDGLTGQELLISLKQEFRPDLKRESLSPQLSRLKSDGELAYENGKWILPKYTSRVQPPVLEAGPEIRRELSRILADDDDEIPF